MTLVKILELEDRVVTLVGHTVAHPVVTNRNLADILKQNLF